MSCTMTKHEQLKNAPQQSTERQSLAVEHISQPPVQVTEPVMMFTGVIGAVISTCLICGLWSTVAGRRNRKREADIAEHEILEG